MSDNIYSSAQLNQYGEIFIGTPWVKSMDPDVRPYHSCFVNWGRYQLNWWCQQGKFAAWWQSLHPIQSKHLKGKFWPKAPKLIKAQCAFGTTQPKAADFLFNEITQVKDSKVWTHCTVPQAMFNWLSRILGASGARRTMCEAGQFSAYYIWER